MVAERALLHDHLGLTRKASSPAHLILLDSGADLNVKNQLGLTALDFAKQYKEPDVVEGLTARLQQMQKQAPQAPQ